MKNPFNLPEEKLLILMRSYVSWLNSNQKERAYPIEFRKQAEVIREEFLNDGKLLKISDEMLYAKIYKYSRSLEGPAYIRLGEPRIKANLTNIRRNLKYIISSEDDPTLVAQNILDGQSEQLSLE
jgi:hypothetical protein